MSTTAPTKTTACTSTPPCPGGSPISSDPGSADPPPREGLLWGLLTAAALLARLAGLGNRALSHDESLHALYSWFLGTAFRYDHDPMMHGPLLFHLNALVFTLFGVSDFTARLLPALAGAGCVALLRLHRRWLGPAGALAAAALLAFSPDLLAYSRYLRNDIYIALFTLLMTWAAWRYREEGRPRHLLLSALALALSFACKEVAFIHGTVFGILFLLFGLRERNARWGDLAGLYLTLALPFATALVHLALGWDPLDTLSGTGQLRTLLTGTVLSCVSWLSAGLWFRSGPAFRTWARAFALFWGIQILLYSTLLTRPARGMSSALAGSLGYWLAQHEVQRGASDPLFYLSLLLLYTPLLLLTLAAALRRIREPFTLFVVLWALGNALVYSWAGERMPWLMLHITLPLCLLAGPELVRARHPLLRGLCGVLVLHLLINSLRASGPLADSPDEPLYYAHGGARLKTAVRISEAHLSRHPGSQIFVWPEYTWPLAWYFRGAPVRYQPGPDPSASVLFAPPGLREELQNAGWTARGEFVLVHWPRQHWHSLTRKNLRSLFRRSETRRRLLRFYFLRDYPPPGPEDFPQPVRFLLLTRTPPDPS